MYLVDRAGEMRTDPKKSAPFDRYVREQHWRRDPTIETARARCTQTPALVRCDPHDPGRNPRYQRPGIAGAGPVSVMP